MAGTVPNSTTPPHRPVTSPLTIEHGEQVSLADDSRNLAVVSSVAELFQDEAEKGGASVLPSKLDQSASPAVVSLHGGQPGGDPAAGV